MKKYRPSSGTEGIHFQDKFCEKCKHKNLQEVFPEVYVKNCEILISTQCYDVDEPEYPSEWVYDPDGNPTCTKFEKMEKENESDSNGKRLIDYIDSRINYYSGGEEMKSMSESVHDSMVVRELRTIKAILNEHNFYRSYNE